MSNELNNQKTETKEQTFIIDNKEYKRSELSNKCLNSIAIRQELESNRIRLSVELEKTNILQKHYDSVIAEEIKPKEVSSEISSENK